MLDAVRPGPIEISVEVLRRGRGAGAARATARQDGSVRLVTQCWLTDEPLAAPIVANEALTQPAPLDCPEIVFRRQELPFMTVMSERAISYPPSSEQFHSGPPVMEVWARPGIDAGDGDLPISQLFDVMILDAHVLDAALRVRPSTDVLTASLDMGAMWHRPLEFETWRRVRTECGPLAAGFVATSGTVHDETGRLFIQAMQQGRVRWPRS
jgi:acyl-CoA thioesterase